MSPAPASTSTGEFQEFSRCRDARGERREGGGKKRREQSRRFCYHLSLITLHSALTPACLTTLAQVSMSRLISAANCWDVPPAGDTPSAASFSSISLAFS